MLIAVIVIFTFKCERSLVPVVPISFTFSILVTVRDTPIRYTRSVSGPILTLLIGLGIGHDVTDPR